MDRKYNNSHNGLNGTVRCIITCVNRIRNAPSLTHKGRCLLVDINTLLESLDKETWTFRQELDGHATKMKHKNEREFPS